VVGKIINAPDTDIYARVIVPSSSRVFGTDNPSFPPTTPERIKEKLYLKFMEHDIMFVKDGRYYWRFIKRMFSLFWRT